MKRFWRFKIIALVLLLAFILPLVGCTDDPDKVVKTTNALYLDIKTVVTDPAVAKDISPDTMERLANLERVYLTAAKALKQAKDGDGGPLANIVSCADEVLTIIDSLVLDGKYEKQITAIRISLKVLKNHLQLE